uniref:hypothetical protein n=1 Tax=uncultured Pseudoalteromonas sp. TaxID=114053 RepID=UPI002599999A
SNNRRIEALEHGRSLLDEATENITFEELLEKAPDEIAKLVEKANVIILPSHGTNDEFYSGTLDTLDFFNNSEIATEIYSTDDNYKELGLHGAHIWLGTFIVKNFLIPIFCGVAATYIYEKLKAKNDDNISLKFIVEKKDGKTTSVSYDGKVENLNKALDAVKELSDES